MKAMILGLVATLVIAVVADQTLARMGFSAAQQGSGGAVRLGE